jgi:predicted nucleotidyltransferase
LSYETQRTNPQLPQITTPFIKQTFKVISIGIFGSYAREEQTEKSDIDLLVEFEVPVGFFKFIELEEHLSEKLGAKVEI